MVWLIVYVFLAGVVSSAAVINSSNATVVCLQNDPNTGRQLQPCQSRARLTPPFADSCGAAWAPNLLPVNDSFTTQFSFQVSNVTGYCAEHQNVYRECRERGGHGLALILHNDPRLNVLSSFIGQCGKGLGYAGISNSLALELDLWHDPDLFDLFDNHVALQSMSSLSNSNDHRNSLAASTDIADLADGQVHTVKIYYQPTIDLNVLSSQNCSALHSCGRFQANSVFASMLTSVYANTASMGLLWVYIDDLVSPLFITPINVNDLIALDQGRAYMGISASTGHFQFQTHDIFNWTFCSSSSCNLII